MKTEKIHNSQETYLAKWLEGELSDTELQKLVSKEDFLLFVKIKDTFEKVEKPSFNTTKNYQKITDRLHKSSPRVVPFIPNWVYSVAAMLVLAFGVFRFYKASLAVETSYGETKEIALNEGTKIYLNNKSTISYPKYQSQRNVTLNGEAFFHVTKKGAFVVSTPLGVIQVLGTQFNVMATDKLFEVICYEGKVRVIYNDVEKILLPSDAWRVIEGKTPQSWTTKETTSGWITGETTFRTMPVKYVLSALEKQYHITIRAKAIDENLLFTGSFPNNNLQKALRSVCLPLQIDYDQPDTNTILLHKK